MEARSKALFPAHIHAAIVHEVLDPIRTFCPATAPLIAALTPQVILEDVSLLQQERTREEWLALHRLCVVSRTDAMRHRVCQWNIRGYYRQEALAALGAPANPKDVIKFIHRHGLCGTVNCSRYKYD